MIKNNDGSKVLYVARFEIEAMTKDENAFLALPETDQYYAKSFLLNDRNWDVELTSNSTIIDLYETFLELKERFESEDQETGQGSKPAGIEDSPREKTRREDSPIYCESESLAYQIEMLFCESGKPASEFFNAFRTFLDRLAEVERESACCDKQYNRISTNYLLAKVQCDKAAGLIQKADDRPEICEDCQKDQAREYLAGLMDNAKTESEREIVSRLQTAIEAGSCEK